MTLFRETSDVSVRPAVSGDETAIVAIQVEAWRRSHGELLGGAIDALDHDAMRGQWAAAVAAPPAGHRVLVACAGATVVGFASIAPVPATDPTSAPGGLLLALEVDPAHQQGGHGSRLLAAAVDLLREDGADQLLTWVLDGDTARAQFLSGAGLGPDDTVRELASGTLPDGTTRTVREHRWWATI